MADMMQRRSSPLVRTVFVVAGLGSIVYLIYLNHDLNTKLKNTDDRAERYRRSHESVSAQLQDLTAAKEESERKCAADRDEMINRLNAIGKDKKMLKSQHEDLKLDYERLQQESDKVKADLENLKTEDNREYQLMKTQKDLELAALKDTVANQVKELDKLRNSLQTCQTEYQNMQALKDTALTNITKLQEETTELKATEVKHQQLITSLQQANQRLLQNVQLAQQNNQQNLQGGQPVLRGQQQPLIQQQQQQQQQQQNGVVVMNQDQSVGATAANQNKLPDVAGGQQNQAQGDGKPDVPDAIDQGQVFQIKPADLGGQKPVGYEHDKQEGGANAPGGGANVPGGGDNAGVPIQRQEDEQQHQVQPPNLKFQKFDDGGLKHMNPVDKDLHEDHDEEARNAQNDHDNSIHNQGPVVLQVQEPVLGGPKDADDQRGGLGGHRGGLGEHRGQVGLEEEEEEEEEDEAQLAQPNFQGDQFMQNDHKLIPRNGENVEEDGQNGGMRHHRRPEM
ncbi:putative mediator of RNA polymerase II transcription subunit 26 isoform X5 [Liolophura sinensis]|uniref:putative mediator of RNA polymerase II transcription subunit 26 isoform X5 n=1 Tax=Liolophura sinensis TaxID=3198878 RepID=UPI0031588AC8